MSLSTVIQIQLQTQVRRHLLTTKSGEGGGLRYVFPRCTCPWISATFHRLKQVTQLENLLF